MKKLHSFAFYALVTPALTLGAGSVLAQQSTGQDTDRKHQSAQHDQGAARSTTGITQSDQSAQRDRQTASQQATDRRDTRDQRSMADRGFQEMDSVPANAMRASDLIGEKVRTKADKDVGSVSDLIIDENGQVVAIVVGVGGFLGMGQKDVAIGWDQVTTPCPSPSQELRIESTREDLQSAPEFKKQD